jgi:hypothetical protein
MSLVIGVHDGRSQNPLRSEPVIAFDDDGYYWFLHPLFEELRAETGEYIDLYGGAVFEGESLVALQKMLANARSLVLAQSEVWSAHCGTQVKPVHKKLFQEVRRNRLLRLLSKFARIAQRAEETGRRVVCSGD